MAQNEINEKTRLSFGIKEFVLITVPLLATGGGYVTNKINTDAAINDLTKRIEKIEDVKPDLLQYQLGQVSNEIQGIKADFKETNRKINEIYNALIK